MQMFIHNVVSIELTEIRAHEATENADSFVTRTIVITCKDGQESKITLTADSATNLKLEV